MIAKHGEPVRRSTIRRRLKSPPRKRPKPRTGFFSKMPSITLEPTATSPYASSRDARACAASSSRCISSANLASASSCMAAPRSSTASPIELRARATRAGVASRRGSRQATRRAVPRCSRQGLRLAQLRRHGCVHSCGRDAPQSSDVAPLRLPRESRRAPPRATSRARRTFDSIYNHPTCKLTVSHTTRRTAPRHHRSRSYSASISFCICCCAWAARRGSGSPEPESASAACRSSSWRRRTSRRSRRARSGRGGRGRARRQPPTPLRGQQSLLPTVAPPRAPCRAGARRPSRRRGTAATRSCSRCRGRGARGPRGTARRGRRRVGAGRARARAGVGAVAAAFAAAAAAAAHHADPAAVLADVVVEAVHHRRLHLGLGREVVGLLGAAEVDGDVADRAEDRAEQRQLEERRVGERAEAPEREHRDERREEQRVEEGGVVRDHQHRPARRAELRRVLEPLQLDVDPRRERKRPPPEDAAEAEAEGLRAPLRHEAAPREEGRDEAREPQAHRAEQQPEVEPAQAGALRRGASTTRAGLVSIDGSPGRRAGLGALAPASNTAGVDRCERAVFLSRSLRPTRSPSRTHADEAPPSTSTARPPQPPQTPIIHSRRWRSRINCPAGRR